MNRYRATIVSPKGAAPKSSVIEFESEHRAGSKLNVQDARYKMLELHGSEALAWTVKDVEKVADSTPGDAPMEQMMGVPTSLHFITSASLPVTVSMASTM